MVITFESAGSTQAVVSMPAEKIENVIKENN